MRRQGAVVHVFQREGPGVVAAFPADYSFDVSLWAGPEARIADARSAPCSGAQLALAKAALRSHSQARG